MLGATAGIPSCPFRRGIIWVRERHRKRFYASLQEAVIKNMADEVLRENDIGPDWRYRGRSYAVPPPIEARMIPSASSRVQPMRALAVSHALSASSKLRISTSEGR